MTDATTLIQYQNLRLHQFQQIIIALNTERTKLQNQIATQKQQTNPASSIEDLIQFDEDAKNANEVEELLQKIEKIKSDFGDEKNRLCEEIRNATELLEEERKKSSLLQLENNGLKEKLYTLSEMRDSGLSDNDSDKNNLSRFRPKFRKKSKNSNTNTAGNRLKEECNYNNPNDPENLNEVLQSLAREKLKTASLTEQVENLQLMINTSNQASRELLNTENSQLIKCKKELKDLKKEYVLLSNDFDELQNCNDQLQNELEDIGEYIKIYRQQRSALKQMQYQENQRKIKENEEKEEMKGKLEYLVILVRQLLADRALLSEQGDFKRNELETTDQILEVIDEVRLATDCDGEPVQLAVEYLGPQWDI